MASGGTSVTIAASGSLSGAADLTGFTLVSIQMPTTWTAAAITFSGSLDGSTYGDVYNTAGTEYTIASASAVASRLIILDPRDFAGVRYLKIRSGTSAATVNQAAARTLVLGFLSGN